MGGRSESNTRGAMLGSSIAVGGVDCGMTSAKCGTSMVSQASCTKSQMQCCDLQQSGCEWLAFAVS